MKKLYKHLIYAFTILAFFGFFVYRKWPDSSIKIVFCYVGQGDSILIQQGFFQVIIDSGRDDQVLGCLGNFLPEWDRSIEMMVLTHGYENHFVFFKEFLGLYAAQSLFFPDTDKDTGTVAGKKRYSAS